MFLLSDLIFALAKVLHILFTLYIWVFVVDAILSWVHPDPSNPLVRSLDAMTEPALSPIRRILPFRSPGLDFSPIVAVLVLIFLDEFLVRTLRHFGEGVTG